jgi:hypothetical protein
MNHFYKRYLWLAKALVCTAAFCLLGVAPIASAQEDSPPLSLTADPANLPTTPGGKVTVTISFNALDTTQLFYYPPFDFEVDSKDGAVLDPDSQLQQDFNGEGRIRRNNISGQDQKTVILKVGEGASPGIKKHRAVLGSDNSDNREEELTLTLPELPPLTATAIDTPTAAAINTPEVTSTDEPASTPRERAPASMDGGQEGTEITGSNEESNRIWLIIGLIGGVFLFVAVIVGIFFFRRSRKRLPQAPLQEPTAPPQTLQGTIGQPYLLDSNGRYFFINTLPFTIGRDMNNNLIIDESFPQWQSVSRKHAQIIQHSQGYVVEDRASQNKLRVQGRPTERNLLRNGWKLHVGGVEFTFFDGSNAPGGAA